MARSNFPLKPQNWYSTAAEGSYEAVEGRTETEARNEAPTAAGHFHYRQGVAARSDGAPSLGAWCRLIGRKY